MKLTVQSKRREGGHGQACPVPPPGPSGTTVVLYPRVGVWGSVTAGAPPPLYGASPHFFLEVENRT
jgi:hypothetical protein